MVLGSITTLSPLHSTLESVGCRSNIYSLGNFSTDASTSFSKSAPSTLNFASPFFDSLSSLKCSKPKRFLRNFKLVVRDATMQSSVLPMRSDEEKNCCPVQAIRNLRLITAIKTPYLPDGRFDIQAYDALVHAQIESGVEGLIIGGTTGEGHLMTWDEHIMLIGHTVNCFGDQIKVIGNTGSNSTREAIHATEQGFAVGMHAALQINPYYGKTSPDGLLAHFEAVLNFGPTIIYNVPGRTSQDVSPTIIEKLALHEKLAGVKECVGNDRVKHYSDQGIAIWSGNDDQCHDARWHYGARGVISVLSNLVPGLARELMFDGQNDALNKKLMPLINWLFHEPNPIPLNTALCMLGLCRPIFRLPYVPCSPEKRAEFARIVEHIGLEHFKGAKGIKLLDDEEFICLSRF